MQKQTIFSEIPAIAQIYREFGLSQGSLYHYTKPEAAKSITETQEWWITRADSFLDDDEIHYGVEILRSVVDRLATAENKKKLESLLTDMKYHCQSSYILSLTMNPANDYLASEYGETVIELHPAFCFNLASAASHVLPLEDGFKLYHFTDLYECVEGMVFYDVQKQYELAERIITIALKLLKMESHIVDRIHLQRLMITCITMFKRRCYHKEEEYRVVLHRRLNAEAPNCERRGTRQGTQPFVYVSANIRAFSPDPLLNVYTYSPKQMKSTGIL